MPARVWLGDGTSEEGDREGTAISALAFVRSFGAFPPNSVSISLRRFGGQNGRTARRKEGALPASGNGQENGGKMPHVRSTVSELIVVIKTAKDSPHFAPTPTIRSSLCTNLPI